MNFGIFLVLHTQTENLTDIYIFLQNSHIKGGEENNYASSKCHHHLVNNKSTFSISATACSFYVPSLPSESKRKRQSDTMKFLIKYEEALAAVATEENCLLCLRDILRALVSL